MPLYFFDTHDGRTHVKDEDGLVLASDEEAAAAARGGLADMARDAVRKCGNGATLFVAVRRGAKPFLRCSLELAITEEG